MPTAELQNLYGNLPRLHLGSTRAEHLLWEYVERAHCALHESAQREAETRRAISVIVTNATGWRGLGGDAVELARRLASEFATAQAEGFKRGVEAGKKIDRDALAHAFIAGVVLGSEEPDVAGDGDEMGARFRAYLEALLPPPTGTEAETHEFVPWYSELMPTTAANTCRSCGLTRSHPIHGGR